MGIEIGKRQEAGVGEDPTEEMLQERASYSFPFQLCLHFTPTHTQNTQCNPWRSVCTTLVKTIEDVKLLQIQVQLQSATENLQITCIPPPQQCKRRDGSHTFLSHVHTGKESWQIQRGGPRAELKNQVYICNY